MKTLVSCWALGLILTTIGTAMAAPIAVGNADMELGTSGNPDVWTESGTVYYPQTTTWTSTYTMTRYFGSYIEQELGVTIDPSKVYTLKLDEIDQAGWGGSYRLQFLAKDGGGTKTVIDEAAQLTAAGTTRVAGLQISGSELAAYGGQELVIRLGGYTSGYQTGGFDNVTVTELDPAAAYGAPTAITVPDNSFEITGISSGWANYPGTGPWQGGGWVDTNSGSPGYSLDVAPIDGTAAIAGWNSQTLVETFVEGAIYTMTAYHTSRDGGWTGAMSLYSEDGSGNREYVDGAPAYANFGSWQQVSLEYVATAADAGKFIGLYVQSDYWDNVSLTVQLPQTQNETVPEPGSVAVWSILGVVGLAIGVRRLRKR